MPLEEKEVPTHRVRLRNTVRFEIVEERRKEIDLDHFVEKILLGLFEVDQDSVYCLQDVPSRGLFDLTFVSESDCFNFYNRFFQLKSNALLNGVTVWLLYSRPLRPLVVHIYNPFVEEDDVLCFLARYCSDIREGTKVRNKFGFWTGKRRFMVRFRADPISPGGYRHPPGVFSIGPDGISLLSWHAYLLQALWPFWPFKGGVCRGKVQALWI